MPTLEPGKFDIVLNGVNIHYTVQGSGPVILAHSGGPGTDARTWGDFARIDDFSTVVAIHPRGSGLSGNSPEKAYALSDYAADLEALRTHLGIARPVVLGWSHGGMVAQHYAFTYPDKLSKLILFDTAAYLGEFLQDIEAAVKAFEDQPWYPEAYAALQKEWDGDYETDEDMSALWHEEMKFYFKVFDDRAAKYREATKDLLMRIESLKIFNDNEAESMDLRPDLRRVTAPTLVIAGRYDFITTVDMAEELVNSIPVARLEVFEDSGHFALVEEPEKFHQIVRNFVLEA